MGFALEWQTIPWGGGPPPFAWDLEQDQESIVDPQSKLQPTVSLTLAGLVKECLFWHCYPPVTPQGGEQCTEVFCNAKNNGSKGEC